jgi:CubicO group peptidase (beta-lactamase class C family)
MKKILSLLVLVSIYSCVKKSASVKDAGNEAVVKDSLTSALNEVYKEGNFAGFGVAIANANGVLYSGGVGYANAETKEKYTQNTLQPIASISKTFIGIALMKAQEIGKLKLDDPINKYLPFKVVNPAFPDVPITIRHLATHTSSITDTDFYLQKAWILMDNVPVNGKFDYPQQFNLPSSKIAMEVFLRKILVEGQEWYSKDGFVKHKPGAYYEYSNIGATLAAFIIEKATGERYDVFTTKYILQPLHMYGSGWSYKNIDVSKRSMLYEKPGKVLPFYQLITYPDGGFITSAEDMGKYLCELIKGFDGTGTLLKKESYKELFRQQLNENNFSERNEQNPYNEEYNTGLFMGFSYKGYVGHTGGDAGVASMLFFDPKTKTGRFLMLNTSFSTKAGNDQFYRIWDILGDYSEKLSVKKKQP